MSHPHSRLDLSHRCPWRPFDWRWHLAHYNESIPGDPWSLAAKRYVHSLETCRRTRSPAAGLVGAAAELAIQREFWRAEVEARVLARQTPAEIADKVQTPLAVVEAFEAVFFDARPAFDHPSKLLHLGVRRSPMSQLGQFEVAAYWRWLGYCLGPLVLDAIIGVVDNATLQQAGVDAYLAPHVALDPDFKLAILTERLPVPQSPREILDFQLLQALWERRRQRRGTPPDLAAPLGFDAADIPLELGRNADEVIERFRPQLRAAA